MLPQSSAAVLPRQRPHIWEPALWGLLRLQGCSGSRGVFMSHLSNSGRSSRGENSLPGLEGVGREIENRDTAWLGTAETEQVASAHVWTRQK
jgi:hypothetical protein